jgi:ATP-dependent Lon protease
VGWQLKHPPGLRRSYREEDLVEIPEEAKQKLRFMPVETVEEVLANALDRS